jgi:hypothetical protein
VNADIGGSVILRNKFSAEGGVCLDTAHVRGDIYMDGASVTGGEDDAFSAQNARIGGMLALREGFVARGTVWLPGVCAGGPLRLNKATLNPSEKIRQLAGVRLDGPLEALVAENAEIGQYLDLSEATVLGQIRLANARIGAGLKADKACLEFPSCQATAMLAEGVSVGHDFEMRGSVVTGTLDLTSARIDGRLALHGTQMFGTRGEGAALSATNAAIGKDAEFKTYIDGKSGRGQLFQSVSKLDLTGVSVAGDLTFEGGRLYRTPFLSKTTSSFRPSGPASKAALYFPASAPKARSSSPGHISAVISSAATHFLPIKERTRSMPRI